MIQITINLLRNGGNASAAEDRKPTLTLSPVTTCFEISPTTPSSLTDTLSSPEEEGELQYRGRQWKGRTSPTPNSTQHGHYTPEDQTQDDADTAANSGDTSHTPFRVRRKAEETEKYQVPDERFGIPVHNIKQAVEAWNFKHRYLSEKQSVETILLVEKLLFNTELGAPVNTTGKDWVLRARKVFPRVLFCIQTLLKRCG